MARETVIDRLVTEFVFRGDQRALRRLEQRLERTRQALNSASRTAGIWGAAITAAGTGALVSFGKYEAELAKIEGLVGISREQLSAWQDDIAEIGRETGKSPLELARSLFFVTSAGLRGSVAMDVLRQSAKASAAGLGDQATIVDLVTSAINAYGSENLSASEATDALIEAVRLGKLEPAELAAAMGRVLPIASAMGVSFNEVAGLMAGMSKTGTTAEEAVTQLNAVMVGLLKPSEDAQEALQAVGLSAEGLRVQVAEQGLFSVLRTLQAAFQGNNQELVKVFPNIRALRGIFDLLGPSLQDNIILMNEMKDSAGETDNAFTVASETLQFKWNQATAGAMQSVNTLGEALKPFAVQVLDIFSRLVGWFQSLSPEVKELAGVALLAGPALIGVSVALKGIALLLSPTLLVAAGIAAAIGGLAYGAYKIYENWGDVVSFFADLWDSIRAVFVWTYEVLKSQWINVRDFFGENIAISWDWITTPFANAIGWIRYRWQLVRDFFANNDVLSFDWLTEPFETIPAWFRMRWQSVKAFFADNEFLSFDWITQPFETIPAWFELRWKLVKAWFADNELLSFAWITQPFEDALAWMKRQWAAVTGFFRDPLEAIFGRESEPTEAARRKMEAEGGNRANPFAWVKDAWWAVIEFISVPFDMNFDWLTSAFTTAADEIKGAWKTVTDLIDTAIDAVFGGGDNELPSQVKSALEMAMPAQPDRLNTIGHHPRSAQYRRALARQRMQDALPAQSLLGPNAGGFLADGFPGALPGITTPLPVAPAPSALGPDDEPLAARTGRLGGRLGIGRNTTINIDKIEITTPDGDPATIAGGIREELSRQILVGVEQADTNIRR